MKDEVIGHLSDLRVAVEEARSVPMSASVMINRTEFLELIDRLEAALDSTLSQATEVVGDRDAVVASGQTEAEEILRQAERDREELVSDTGVFKVATARAEELVEGAEKESRELRAETDEYVEGQLANFEATLEGILQTVRRGRSRLTHGHVHGLGDDSDVADIALPEHLEP